MKTDTEYLASSGECPFCSSSEVEGVGSMDIEGDTASNEISCLDCEQSWYDIYKLVGFESKYAQPEEKP